MGKPQKSFLRKIISELERHVNFMEGWENGNPKTNGEYMLLSKVIPKAKIIFDIGANIGDWTNECLVLNPDAKIFAFEASPQTAKTFLARHSAKKNVKMFNYGLRESDGFLEFFDYGENSGGSSFYNREKTIGISPDRAIKVETKRLDTIEELKDLKKIDFVKIDTEGAEINVLRGASEFLKDKKIRILQFEYGAAWIDSRSFLADAFTLLSQYGYIIGRLCPKKVCWLDNYHSDLESFKYANFIACASKDEAKTLGLT